MGERKVRMKAIKRKLGAASITEKNQKKAQVSSTQTMKTKVARATSTIQTFVGCGCLTIDM